MYSTSLTSLSGTCRHLRQTLKPEAFKSVHLHFRSIEKLYYNQRLFEQQGLSRFLSFVRELSICPNEITTWAADTPRFQSEWSETLAKVVRSAPRLERLHLYEISFQNSVLEAIKHTDIVHLLTSHCELTASTSDLLHFPRADNSRIQTVCHYHPDQLDQDGERGRTPWIATFFVPSLTRMILSSALEPFTYPIPSLADLPNLRQLSVLAGPGYAVNLMSKIETIFGGSASDRLEEVEIRPHCSFRARQFAVGFEPPSLPQLRRLKCQMQYLPRLFPGHKVEELEIDVAWDAFMPPDVEESQVKDWGPFWQTMRSGKGNLKKNAIKRSL
ncbi:hypothetical protein FRB90_005652 [Tulasnella sp. 427]|nr:hypothetical protein FRB90_005652 [Tulasnella sp. 427]